MDKKDLMDNPLDDYIPGPSVLDKATAAIADHIGNKYKEAVEIIEQVTESVGDLGGTLAENIEIATPTAKPIGIATAAYSSNPFTGSCPEFDIGEVKQAIVKQQWNICRNRWDFQQTDSSIPRYSTANLQEVAFATVVYMVSRLSVENFVAIQPIEHELAKIFYLEVQNAETDMRTKGAHCDLNIVSNVVESVALKLQAKLTIEAFQDFSAMHGTEFRYELAKVLGEEIETELYKVIYKRLYDTSHRVSVDFKSDETLGLQIYKETIDIAARSYRGAGNKIIVSHSILASLLRAEAVEVIDDESKRYGIISYVGKLGNCIDVFSDVTMPANEAIIVYKGGSGETDAGLIYCPHKMLVAGSLTVDPSTFQPSMPLFTQYALHENNLSNYVSHMTFDKLEYSVEDDRMITELFKTKPISSAMVKARAFYGTQTLRHGDNKDG